MTFAKLLYGNEKASIDGRQKYRALFRSIHPHYSGGHGQEAKAASRELLSATPPGGIRFSYSPIPIPYLRHLQHRPKLSV